MKRYLILVIISSIWLLSAIAPGKGEQMQQVQDVQAAGTYQGALRPDINFGKIPLYFVANQGQVNEKVLFYAKASRYTLWITKHGLIFDSTKRTVKGNPKFEYRNRAETKQIQNSNVQNLKQKQNSLEYSPLTKYQRDVSRFMFVGANKNPEMVPVDEAKLRVNYFKGKDKSKWHCDIPTSKAVLYKSLYKNIDLNVYGIEKEIEYDWIVKPGGNPYDIRFEYKHVKGTRLDEEGNLLIETDFGELMHKKPVAYQNIKAGVGAGPRACPSGNKNQIDVDVTFKKVRKNTYGFEVGEYDKGRELIIDPVVLAYSTYLGGRVWDRGYGIAVDDGGYAYVTGETYSSNFPTLDQYQSNPIDYDVFIAKINTTKNGASSLIYSTYLGGSDADSGYGIAVDGSGCAYVTGYTSSSDFPTLNQYQANQGDNDAFTAKIDTTKNGASSLIYSTYLGGKDADYGRGIAVDGSGYAYVTGYTSSSDFPTLNEYQSFQGAPDVFITKIDATKSGASSLIYSTYLGGNSSDWGYGIAVDDSGHAYVTGVTGSSNFPTLNQYQSFQGAWDTFITKIDTTKSGASGLIYSSCLGGKLDEWGQAIAVDGSGCAYVTGDTTSSDFPILDQYQPDQGFYDAFITKIDTAKKGNSSLIYSTYLGGSDIDRGYGIAVDGSGCVFVTGYTESPDFPTLNQYLPYQGDKDAFIAKIDTTKKGSSGLMYSTYVGGEGSDSGSGIAVDGSGCAYVTGYTYSTDFPTLNQYQGYRGDRDVFITKLVLCTGTPSVQLNRTSLYFAAVSGGSQTGSQTVSVDISGGCGIPWTASCDETWIEVTPTNGTGSALATVSVDTAGLAAGTYTGTVLITYASASDSITVNLTIHDTASTSIPFGDFSTPPDGSVARGSIPVTGWVLDDIQVESVKIYRDGSIYIGNAVFVDGARPDVEAAFPDYPFNYRAGWGYMLLTNFFPNGGNGTYTLHVAATDVEGNTVILGAKTIVCDNANAVKPFGAIDTPAQGGTASGSGYINFGWVLTPKPNAIPTDGSTIHVFVDGVKLGNPTYNNYRADIASLFPGYANSNGAVGYFILDTTAYTNGRHTIYWTAEDDAGNKDGIGSRFFNIQNSGSAARMFNAQVQGLLSDVEPGQLPTDYSTPVTVKKGFGRNIEPQKLYADDNGIITVETRELERVEIRLDGDITSSTASSRPVPLSHVPPRDSYIYLNTGGRLRPLPIGSTFDAERDILYWQPGPGFIGEYNFLFIKKGPDGEWQKKVIRVVINPGNR